MDFLNNLYLPLSDKRLRIISQQKIGFTIDVDFVLSVTGGLDFESNCTFYTLEQGLGIFSVERAIKEKWFRIVSVRAMQ